MDDQTTALLGARPVEEMLFEGGEPVRDLLRTLGIKTAHDIELLGCTGAKAQGLSIEQIAALRLSLAGGGVGLPCFVGIDRFCLAHNTIGGLQEQQEQRHKEFVEAVSRPLTKEERGRIELIEAARRKQGKTLGERLVSTGDILSGRELPDGFAADVPNAEQDRVLPRVLQEGIEQARRGEVSPVPMHMLQDWECPEHKKTNWACRYCVAQAIVEGPLVPVYALLEADSGGESGEDHTGLTPEEMHVALERADAKGLEYTAVYVKAATYERRLARVEEG